MALVNNDHGKLIAKTLYAVVNRNRRGKNHRVLQRLRPGTCREDRELIASERVLLAVLDYKLCTGREAKYSFAVRYAVNSLCQRRNNMALSRTSGGLDHNRLSGFFDPLDQRIMRLLLVISQHL